MAVIKSMSGNLHVALCKALKPLGIAGQYYLTHLPQNAAQTRVLLWMIPLSGTTSYLEYNELKSENDVYPFEFAIQTGFDGTDGSVAIGDSIEYNGKTYQIDKINQDQAGSIFTVFTSAKTARVI